MKILVIPSWYPPNGGWFFKEHAMAVASLGPEVDVMAGVYTSMRKTSPATWFSAHKISRNTEEKIREIIKPIPIIPFSEKLNYNSWVRAMLRMYDEYHQQWGHPDIIHVHSSVWAGVVAAHIKRRYKIPYIITEHRSRFVYNIDEARNMFRPWHTDPLKDAFANAGAIITVSKSLHGKITDICPHASSKLEVIFNMVDTDFFTPGHQNYSPGNPFHLFCLANLERVKGIDILLEALVKVIKNDGGNLHLTLGGDGSERMFLMRYCKQHGIEKYVTFKGKMNRDQAREGFMNAHAFVLPSRFEAFGVVYIEAMSAGLPVLAARAGGPETFITPDTGILIPVEDSESLAHAIIRMRNNYHSFNREAIRDYTTEKFSRPVIAGQYLSLYQQILHNS